MNLTQYLILPLLLAAAPAAVSQQTNFADDGVAVGPILTPGPSVQAPGSLTTHFLGGNGFAGNMFDFTPSVDMEITGLDFHGRANTNSYDIDLWYRVGSAVGFETTSTGWMLIASGSAVNNGSGVGTFVDLSGNGVTLLAGQTYGMCMDNSNYSVAGGIAYTNTTSRETYTSAEATLVSHCGTTSPAFISFFANRCWNGTLYYEFGPTGPSLAVTNLVAGGVATVSVSGATPNGTVRHGYSLRGGGPTTTPWGDLLLSPPYTELPAMTADAAGDASVSAPVPAGTTGVTVWQHALDLGSLTFTNGLMTVIG
ncbi:MAG: hypothetical protein H8E31_02275 [Planctomycetes bacterium]|nr:hypothetical protein [Planctomycetota bacterium]